jgi:hypothetical protein
VLSCFTAHEFSQLTTFDTDPKSWEVGLFIGHVWEHQGLLRSVSLEILNSGFKLPLTRTTTTW